MIRVVLLAAAPGSAEEQAAWLWLQARPGIAASYQRAEEAAGIECDVVWLHAGAPADIPVAPLRLLRPRGAFLCTGAAAAVPAALGYGPAPELHERVWRAAEDDLFFHDTFAESPRIRGHAGFRAHPLFEGLDNGAFTWRPTEGEPFRTLTHARATAGALHVVACERAYIHVNAERVTAWEHHHDDGHHALCIGAYCALTARDPFFRPQLERLLHNALAHAAHGCRSASARADEYWPAPGSQCTRDDRLALPHIGAGRPARLSFAATPLRMSGASPTDPFTLAGRRALAAGTEGSGVQELWVHPIRALRALRITDAQPLAAEITALGIERTLRLGSATLDERVMVPHELGALVVEWEASEPLNITVEFETDLRLMWPYPPGVLGDLRWRADGHVFLARAAGAPDAVCCHLSRTPIAWEVEELHGEAPCLRVRATVPLTPGESLRFVAAASSSGEDDLEATLAALRDPLSLTRARTASLRRLQRDTFALATPEPRLDEALEWAKYRLDSFLVATPGVGRSLVAGYWHSQPGWGDGRPGYGWYFGRDAVWTALASLALGDFDASRDVIRFLGEHQDVSGKILHECTTSGLVHYDAADATPLYLLLLARHHAWTGEIGFINGEWETVQKALRFCLSTDTDGDGLIENPGVGHGWIEFGRLGGGTLTYYNAGIWCAALRELAIVAEDIGDRALAADLHSRAKKARLALEERFFDAAQRRYALKTSRENGEWIADYTPTATHAVPLLLGVADADRAGSFLDDVASTAFSADWGVRMIPDTHELFNPKSYHGGAVWPLYTGWTAWAEYHAGRADAALRHLLANTSLAYERAKGAWDEVLHGSERVAAGVCPDQAWSAALAVAPIVYGMLGADPDATRNRLRLRPQIPPHWDHFEARMLRVGDNAITLRYERHREHHVFRIEQERGGSPVRLVLEPVLDGSRIRHALVDGVPADLVPVPFAHRMMVPIQVVLDAERVIEVHTE